MRFAMTVRADSLHTAPLSTRWAWAGRLLATLRRDGGHAPEASGRPIVRVDSGGEVMQLSLEACGDVRILRVKEAKLTYPVLSSFFVKVVQVVEDGARKLVIDLEAVSFIDSASIGCLAEIHRLLKDRTGAVKLSALQPRVETMLTMAGMRRVLDLHRRTADAIAAFAEAATPDGASGSTAGTGTAAIE